MEKLALKKKLTQSIVDVSKRVQNTESESIKIVLKQWLDCLQELDVICKQRNKY